MRSGMASPYMQAGIGALSGRSRKFRCSKCVYRFSSFHDSWSVNCATCGIVYPRSNSRLAASCRRSWNVRSAMPSTLHARVKAVLIVCGMYGEWVAARASPMRGGYGCPLDAAW
jgi:hypothetical protein